MKYGCQEDDIVQEFGGGYKNPRNIQRFAFTWPDSEMLDLLGFVKMYLLSRND